MGNLNDITFIKTNGGMGRTAASEDPISGLIFGGFGASVLTFGEVDGNLKGFAPIMNTSTPPAAVSHIRKFEYKEELATAGIVWTKPGEGHGTSGVLDDTDMAKNALHYHISEFFRMSHEGTLYVLIKAGANNVAAADLTVLQNFANGAIRQCGVFDTADTPLTPTELQAVLTGENSLEEDHMPMSVVMTYNGEDKTLAELTEDNASLAAEGKCNVSVLIGCDGDATLASYLEDDNTHYAHYGCIGACIGAISKAAVNECIAWVQKFPLGLTAPALFNGQLIKNVSTADQKDLNENRYIFVRTHVGNADNYFNDSHTCDLATSDYAYIENVRTIDKACRGVRAYLLPYLNSPLQVDAETGRMDAPTVAFLETIASKALIEMEKNGELSGYRVEIDPDQNVISTSQVEIIIKNVPTGTMRKVNVKIGFTTSLS